MKKIIFIAALFISCLSFQLSHAQIRFHVNVNIGSQPEWGPVGYSHVDYYYMPDIDAYYYVPTHQYVYRENNIWVHRTYLPAQYRGYDVYHGYKVVINHPSPWLRHSYYHNTYASYRGRAGQSVIRDSRDARYSNHWHASPGRGHDNGHFDHGNHGGRGNEYHSNGHSNHGNEHHGNHGGGHGHGH